MLMFHRTNSLSNTVWIFNFGVESVIKLTLFLCRAICVCVYLHVIFVVFILCLLCCMALFILILIKLNSYRTKQRHVNKICCISLQLWFQEPCICSVWHAALLRNGAGDDRRVIYGCGLRDATCMNVTWSHMHNHWSMSHLTCLPVHFCMPHSCWYKTVDFRQWNIQDDKNFGSLSLIILWLKNSVGLVRITPAAWRQ
jgi:hypothetical protein